MALGHWAKTYLNPNGGGTELPSVTASDNGKVLGVDGGEYKLVEQNGGNALGNDIILLNEPLISGAFSVVPNGAPSNVIYSMIPLNIDINVGDEFIVALYYNDDSYASAMKASIVDNAEPIYGTNAPTAAFGSSNVKLVKVTEEFLSKVKLYVGIGTEKILINDTSKVTGFVMFGVTYTPTTTMPVISLMKA